MLGNQSQYGPARGQPAQTNLEPLMMGSNTPLQKFMKPKPRKSSRGGDSQNTNSPDLKVSRRGPMYHLGHVRANMNNQITPEVFGKHSWI